MRAERLWEEFQVELDPCAYDLHPGTPPEGLPRSGSPYPPAYQEHIRRNAREAGIEMRPPPIIAYTRLAHQATEFARDHGRLLPFQRAVFRAYWEEGQDIGDVEVLCRLASACGLDPQALRQALAEGRYAQRVEEQMRWARSVGTGGVPTFIFNDRFALMGAQEYEVFLDVARRIVRGEVKDA